MNNRMIKTIISGNLGHVITIFYQLCSVPLFLSNWGTEIYATWIVLFTVPSIIGMMELGFFSVVVNRVSHLRSINKINQSYFLLTSINTVITSFFIISTIVSLAVFTLSVDGKVVFIASYSLGVLLTNFQLSQLKARQMTDLNNNITNLIRLFEYSVIVLFSVFSDNLNNLTLLLLFVRLGIIFGYNRFILDKYSLYRFGSFSKSIVSDNISYKELKDNSIYSVSLILNNQILVLLVSLYFSDAAIVVYSSLRTLFRLPNQICQTLSQAMFQEYILLFNKKCYYLMNNILKKHLIVNSIIVCVCIISFYKLANNFISVWYGDSLDYERVEFLAMLLYCSIFTLWQPVYYFLLSRACYSYFSYAYFIIQVGLIISIFIFKDKDVFYLSLVLSESLMFIYMSVLAYLFTCENKSIEQ